MFATTVQAELNVTLHVCESGLQDIRIFLGLVPTEPTCIKKVNAGDRFHSWGKVAFRTSSAYVLCGTV
jgi:hypothetical protein